MKLTRILPKSLAIAWQEYDIDKMETHYQYHQQIADNLKVRLYDAKNELERLKENYHV
jgi:hypothetical protein